MSNNKILILLTGILFMILTAGCSNCSVQALDTCVFDFHEEQTLVFRIKNLSKGSYFISKNSWLSNIGDTLYIEGVYKRRKNTDPIISYYQFNPPSMQEVKSDSSFVAKIEYADLQVRILQIVAIRVFRNDIPYDKDKDHQRYHSEKEFLKYEDSNSLLLFAKIQSIDSIPKW